MTSPKPIVFFSHSSQDSAALSRLKQLFVQKTGGAIEVFLSSDGQSIQFGKNWVVRVEQALADATLMFAFITLRSLESDWLLFEMGYAYGRGTRVVPIGFSGVDLAVLPPPIGLIQGFNIGSEDGLNNILAVVNEELQHSHELGFTRSDYDEIAGLDQWPTESSLGVAAHLLSSMELLLPTHATSKPAADGVIARVRDALLPDCTETNESGHRSIIAPGFTAAVVEQAGNSFMLRVKIDPFAARLVARTVRQLAEIGSSDGLAGGTVRLVFGRPVYIQEKVHIIAGRLKGLVTIHSESEVLFRNVFVRTLSAGNSAQAPILDFRLRQNDLAVDTIADLLQLYLDGRLMSTDS